MTKNKSYASLWVMFIVISFTTLTLTFFISTFLLFKVFKPELAVHEYKPLIYPIIPILILSIIIGVILFLFIGRIIITPITKISEATKKVSQGNFDIRIEEETHVKEIHNMIDNFNIMTRELSSVETLRDDFVSNVSHEFKTPLAAISGYATLLQSERLSKEEKQEYTNIIIDSISQLSNLTGNILSLSKIENQEIVLDQVKYRLDEQIREVILLLEPQWSQKEIDLQINLQKTYYCGPKDLMKQVWTNIIENAIKFSHDYGLIIVDLSTQKNSIIFSIEDNGIGMSESDLKHIFDKFYQADHNRKQQGNGLGLTLVYQILSLCKGSIDVKSQLKKGTKITIELPINTN